ncbi:hypothetical protein HRbin17_01253 [bacterium HR17]|uniref:Uncharacterized protein n=1 Tax=Candidatus Fervidibacter japonicus TaxID=2035412 RepID=A0A2H5XC24_9BACT|nr:hypothetical protein HRbin17_01253 [bacterium HR17]
MTGSGTGLLAVSKVTEGELKASANIAKLLTSRFGIQILPPISVLPKQPVVGQEEVIREGGAMRRYGLSSGHGSSPHTHS